VQNVLPVSVPGFRLPSDIAASACYYAHDVVAPDVGLHDDSTLGVP
jgi:hypothetical protein